MNYENNKHIDDSKHKDNITRIANNIYSIEDNNIRDTKKRERDDIEQKMIERQKNIFVTSDPNLSSEQLIPKLRRILSKKFDLTLNDYIIIIDKFKLNSSNLSRAMIEEMIEYLKIYTKYSNSAILNKTYSKENEIHQSKVSILDKADFDKSLEDMVKERAVYIDTFLSKDITKNYNETDNIQFEISNTKYNNYNVNTDSISTNSNKDFDNMPKISKDNNYNVNTDQLSTNSNEELYNKSTILADNKSPCTLNLELNDISLLKNENIENDIRKNILNINQNVRDQFNSGTNSKDLSLINNVKIIEEILMFNILQDEINDMFCVKINYDNKDFIENIIKIQFIGCYMNKTFCEKNNIHTSPSLIIRINEFNNFFYINGSKTSGFCQCLLEKKNNFYTYTHTDNFFGTYKPENNFILSQLTIQLLNISGTPLTDFNYTNNDIINLMFKITREIK